MSLTTTTLTTAVAVNDTNIVVASATSFVANMMILVDQEVMLIQKSYTSGTTVPVLRGQEGSVTSTHKATANVTIFLASDESGPPAPLEVQFPIVRGRRMTSISATATVAALPGEDLVLMLNGTTAIPLTLTAPTKDMDGCIVYVVANGKAAHTVAVSGGIGAGGTGVDVGTYAAGAQNCQGFIASNGVWVMLPSLVVTGPAATGTTNTVTWA